MDTAEDRETIRQLRRLLSMRMTAAEKVARLRELVGAKAPKKPKAKKDEEQAELPEAGTE